MAKTGNPFFNGTFGDVDLAAMFDPSKYDFGKLNGAFKMPSVDSAEFVKIQQKNIEVLTAANRIAFEGARALMERQVEIAREAMARAAEAVNEISASETIEGRLAKQAEVAKTAFEKSVTDLRELTELSAKSGREAADLLNSRVVESFDEVVAQFNKAA